MDSEFCVVCRQRLARGGGLPLCDKCRDENPSAEDRARRIEAAGDPTPEEEAEMYDDDSYHGISFWPRIG